MEKSHLLGWHSQSCGCPEKVIVTSIKADGDDSEDGNVDVLILKMMNLHHEDDGDNDADE